MHADHHQINRAGDPQRVVRERHRREQRGKPERERGDVHERPGADAEGGHHARAPAVADAARRDVHHVRSRREIERQRRRHEERERLGGRHAYCTSLGT